MSILSGAFASEVVLWQPAQVFAGVRGAGEFFSAGVIAQLSEKRVSVDVVNGTVDQVVDEIRKQISANGPQIVVRGNGRLLVERFTLSKSEALYGLVFLLSQIEGAKIGTKDEKGGVIVLWLCNGSLGIVDLTGNLAWFWCLAFSKARQLPDDKH